MRLTFPKAKKLCGLDEAFEIRSEEDYNFALRVWRDQTIEARRRNDDNHAAELSQCKQLFKRRYNNRVMRKCPTCGEAKSAHADHCQPCSITYRFYHNQLHTHSIVMKEHEIEEALAIIPPRHHATGVLAAICRKLATTGQVGDSFITDKQPTTVKSMARLVGMEVTVRIANLDERDLKKRRWRVWRTDGKEMEEVNEIIKLRMAGEPVPPSPPCVPPPPESLPDKHPERKKAGRPKSKASAPQPPAPAAPQKQP